MAFTTNSKRLVAAYDNMMVIKATSEWHWCNIQVIEYPGIANALTVSPGWTIVACGTEKEELWLWKSETNCQMCRICVSGDPHTYTVPLDTLNLSSTGRSLIFTQRGGSTVDRIRATPLRERDFSFDLCTYQEDSIGQTVTCLTHGYGATALGGEWGARVEFWRYNLLSMSKEV